MYRNQSLTTIIEDIPPDRYPEYLPLVMAIEGAFATRPRVIMALDGRAASGKTTLVTWLARHYQCQVIHTDDFYLPADKRKDQVAGHMNLEALLETVILPLSRGQGLNYQRFDCQSATYKPVIDYDLKPLVIIEGAYSLHPDLAAYYHLSVFYNLVPADQVLRILHRNGKEGLDRFKSLWIPKEEAYIEAFKIIEKAGLVIENLPQAYGAKSSDKAEQMVAYMKGKFKFLGLTSSVRSQLEKSLLKYAKKSKVFRADFVENLWRLEERDFQYTAIAYMAKMVDHMQASDIQVIEDCIVNKSWWDTIDGLAINVVGPLVRRHPELLSSHLDRWVRSDNFWLARTSILYQLKYKGQTDTHRLSEAIVANANTKEFFLNKAIGWALREYSKTNPDWVRNFIKSHALHSLSVREGSKYL